LRGCLFGVIFLIFAFWGFFFGGFNKGNNISLLVPENLLESRSDFVSMSDGEDFIWKFKFGKIFDKTLVYFDDFNFKVGKSAFTSFIALTDEDYKEFLQITECKKCAAPFLNRKTKMFAIIYDDKAVEEALNSCKRGDDISIYGNYLDFKVESKKYEKVQFNLPRGSYFLYVNSIRKY